MEGWIKLHRKSIKNGWLKNHKLWTFWCYCLLKASGVDSQTLENYNQVKLKRGQFIFGLKKASKEIRMSVQSIRTCITFLESSGNINKQSNNQFSIITVLNYNVYNSSENKSTDLLTNAQQTSNKRVTTLKKDKERKEVYIEFVYLTTKEHTKLVQRFGEQGTVERLKRLNNYIGSKGRQYKSHYYTILSWEDKDKPQEPQQFKRPDL